MTETNGKVPTIQQLREQRQLVRARTRLAEARREQKLAEAAGDAQLGFGWSDYLNPYQFRLDPFGNVWLPLGVQLGGVAAHKDGRNAPFVQSDSDLDKIRGLARWLSTKNDLAIGILDNLCNFTVKKGYEWDTRPTEGNEEDARANLLAAQVKRVIKKHDQINNLKQRERSAFNRAVRDGDAITRHFRQDDGTTLVRFVAAEQLRDPGDRGPDASFGVETDPEDAETPLHYHVTYDGTAFERVRADDVSHLKRNVDEEVKRGLSDFYSAGDTLDDVSKLLRNMRKGGGVLAAMAWIEEFEAATRDQMGAHQDGLRDRNRPQVDNPLTGRKVDYQQMEPGTVVRVQKGKKYLPPPLAGNTTNFTGIVQACLRSVGVRWNLPEYMSSGDASNANMASLLVSGSPTVNTFECQQDRFGALFLRWRWIAVKNACDAGLIDGDFEEVQRLVEIHYTAPLVAISNEGEQAEVDGKDIAAGVLSLQTRRARRKLDNEQERKNLAEEPPTRVAGRATDLDAAGNPVGTGAGAASTPKPLDHAELLRMLQSVQALQTAVYSQQMPRDAGLAALVAVLRVGPAEAEALLPEVPPDWKTGEGDQGGKVYDSLGRHIRRESLRESRSEGEVWQGESGRHFTIKNGHVVPAKGPQGGSFADTSAAMAVAHPFPPPRDLAADPPGMGRPDLVAKDPALQKAIAIRDAHGKLYHRAFVAATVNKMLAEEPARPVPLPGEGEDRIRGSRAKQAIERAETAAQDYETLTDSWRREHHADVAAAHPQGAEALDAARAEAGRRFGVMLASAREHVAALPPDMRERAERLLAAALDRGTLESLHEARSEGEVWQGPSKRWFTLKDGHVVPHAGPGAEEGAAIQKKAAQDAANPRERMGLWDRIRHAAADLGFIARPKVPGPAWKEVSKLDVSGRMDNSPPRDAFVKEMEDDPQRKKRWEHVAQQNGQTVEETRKKVAENLNKMIEPLRVSMRVRSSARLDVLLDSGVVKNQFYEGVRSEAAINDRKLRATVEEKSMGVPPDAPAEHHPVYAYLTYPDNEAAGVPRTLEAADRYGKWVVNFKPQVKNRMTVSYGDSLMGGTGADGNFVACVPGAAHAESIDPGLLSVHGMQSSSDFQHLDQIARRYVEAHVHGETKLSDVESIEFHKDFPPSDAQKQKLSALGISWKVY